MFYFLFYILLIFNVNTETVVCKDSFLVLKGIPIESSIFVDSISADSFIEIKGETLYFNKELPDSFLVSYSYIDIKPIDYSKGEKKSSVNIVPNVYSAEEKNGIDLKGSRITGIKSDKYGISIVQSTNINIYGTLGNGIYIEGVLSDDKPMEGPFLVRRLGEWNDMYVRLRKNKSYLSIGNISSQLFGDLTGLDIVYAFNNIEASFTAGRNRGKEGIKDIKLTEGIMGPYEIYDNKGFYIIPNSVKIYLNGKPLKEGVDYEIDYYSATFSLIYPNVPLNGDIAHVVYRYAENNLYPLTIYGDVSIPSKIGKITVGGMFYNETLDTVGMSSNDIMAIKTADTTDMIVVDGGIYVGENKGHYIREDSIYVYKGYNMGNMEVYFTYKGQGNGDYIFSPSVGGFVYVGNGNGDYVSQRYLSLPSKKKNVLIRWKKGESSFEADGGTYIGNVFTNNTNFIGKIKGEINEKYNVIGLYTCGYYYTQLYDNKDYSLFHKTSKWWIIPYIPKEKYMFNDLFFDNQTIKFGFVYSVNDSLNKYVAGSHFGLNYDNLTLGGDFIYQADTSSFRVRGNIKKNIKNMNVYSNISYYGGNIYKKYYKIGYIWHKLWKDADIWGEYGKGDTLFWGHGFDGIANNFVPSLSYLIKRYNISDTLKNIIMFSVGNNKPLSYKIQSSVKYGENYIVYYESVMPGSGDFSYDTLSGVYYPDDEGDYIQVKEKVNTDSPYIENSGNIGFSKDYKKIRINIFGSGSYVKEGNYFDLNDIKKYSLSYSVSIGGTYWFSYDLSYMFYMNEDMVYSMYNENRNYNMRLSYKSLNLSIFLNINKYDYPYSSYYENIKGLKTSFSVNNVNFSPFIKLNNYVSSESKSFTYSIGSDYTVNLNKGKMMFFYNGSMYMNNGESEGDLPYYLKKGMHWINGVSVSYPLMGAVIKGKFSYTIHADETEKSLSLVVENDF